MEICVFTGLPLQIKFMKPYVLIIPALLLSGSVLKANDWTKFRGAAHNGITTEIGLNPKFSASGPRKLWSKNVGLGYSSMSVKGNRLYTMGSKGGEDSLTCLNTDTGEVVWRAHYKHGRRDYGADPNPTATGSTPTIDGSNVYVLSRDGIVFCFDAAKGNMIWAKNVRQESGAETPSWGFTGSPLVDGNLVIVNVGASGCALNKTTSRIVWKSRGMAGYSTPLPFSAGGQRVLVLFTGKSVVGVSPASGRVGWTFPWSTSYEVNAADPVVIGDSLFISSGYSKGGSLLRFTNGRPQPVYETRQMRTQFNSCVLINGFIYGNDDGRLKCLDAKTGAVKWQARGMGNGGLIAAGKTLLVTTQEGELLTVSANPNAYTEISRAKVLGGTCWIQPVFANGKIFVKNNEGDVVALDARGK